MARQKGRHEGRNPSNGGEPKAHTKRGWTPRGNKTGGDQNPVNPKGKPNKR